MARLPYSHFGTAVSAPFSMPHPLSSHWRRVGQSSTSEFQWDEGDGGKLRFDASASADASGNPASAAIPMHSPVWIAALLMEGLGPSWSRLPLPLSPRLPYHHPTSTGGTSTAAGGPAAMLDIAQVAFSAATWAGSSVALFATAILLPSLPEMERAAVQSSVTQGSSADGSSNSSSLPPPPILGVWQVSFQLRCDDARVRAALAADMPDLIAQATCGRFVTISHGHESGPSSLLKRLDASMARDLEAVDASVVSAGTTSSVAVAQRLISFLSPEKEGALEHFRYGISPLLAAAAGAEARSAGGHRDAFDSSLFSVFPLDVMMMQQQQQQQARGVAPPRGVQEESPIPDRDAYAALSTLFCIARGEYCLCP